MDQWPIKQNTTLQNLPEHINSVNLVATSHEESLGDRFNLDRFSKLQLLLNTAARILKFYRRYKRRNNEVVGTEENNEITAEDIKGEEYFWVKEAQKELKQPMEQGKLIRLTPRWKGELIAVGGRTRWVAATWNNEEFVLLPYAHGLSYLIASDTHIKGGHLGISSTMAQIRSRFWIINLPRMVKKLCSNCVPCRKKSKYPCGQIMSDLPEERLRPTPPFYTTGVDFFGPYHITGEVNKRSRRKCYGLIFTCFTTRAVHPDSSTDYSTDAFLQTVERFTSIRGWLHEFRSDNGSQLITASKELMDVVNELDHQIISSCALLGRSNWNFRLQMPHG